ncbi:heme ABC transporter ATP-binding protein [Neptunomonas phycophila]|uniref:heme ABC transporter ATP-binding protein n=1 Tax=Neptunomonas phycophila TaxID=1572645 RepID=UPI0026E3D50F|nr:heme ABC transporter ATP-binding protein [Neptunomonas phycophila]MDO6469076.1 heme ABC transporter ATP-binding protein [Neptunomonas phycophila]
MKLSATRVNLMVGTKRLLSDVSIDVQPGKMIALMGPNGAGKSTLLKVLAGEYTGFSGELSLNRERYHHWNSAQRARVLGVLPQQSSLNFPFSVEEVVLMGRLPHLTSTPHNMAVVSDVLERVDLTHLTNQAYPSLSGGEKQRVHLARVLAQVWEDTGLGPRYFLLDEPTSALDLCHQHQVLRQVKELTRQEVGVLAVLHDLNLAASYADELVFMDQASVQAKGRPQEVLQPALLSRIYNTVVDVIPHPTQARPLVIAS